MGFLHSYMFIIIALSTVLQTQSNKKPQESLRNE
jgi:hypothetical protein